MANHSSSDDLDQLLDSALDDFTKLDLASTARGGDGEVVDGGEERPLSPSNASSSSWSSSSSAVPALAFSSSRVQGLGMGMGLPDPRQVKKKGKQQQQQQQRAGGAGGHPMGLSHASEALAQLTQQTHEAVLGLESAAVVARAGPGDPEKEVMVEDFVKQFEELAGSQDMESIVETMMQQLLSKEILHEPMKEIGERYPRWLEENKTVLQPEEYDRYHNQYELILKLNEVYEHDPGNFPKIVELMQKMQECGQPPSDIVQELAPDLDLSNLGGQLSPELLESTSNCCIM